jgi:hypothetical protein
MTVDINIQVLRGEVCEQVSIFFLIKRTPTSHNVKLMPAPANAGLNVNNKG